MELEEASMKEASVVGMKRSRSSSLEGSDADADYDLSALDNFNICVRVRNLRLCGEDRVLDVEWYIFNPGGGADCVSIEKERLAIEIKRLDARWGRKSSSTRPLLPPLPVPPPIPPPFLIVPLDHLNVRTAVVCSFLYFISPEGVFRFPLAPPPPPSAPPPSPPPPPLSPPPPPPPHGFFTEEEDICFLRTRCAPMLRCRRGYAIAVLDGKLFVFGGKTIGDDYLSPSPLQSDPWAEFLDPKGEDVWKALPEPPVSLPRFSLSTATIHSPRKKILIGSFSEPVILAFDLADSRWEAFWDDLQPKPELDFPFPAASTADVRDFGRGSVWVGDCGTVRVGSTQYCFNYKLSQLHAYDYARNKGSRGYLEAPGIESLRSIKDFARAPFLFHLTGQMFCLFWWYLDHDVPSANEDDGTWHTIHTILRCTTFLVTEEEEDNHNEGKEGSLCCTFLYGSSQSIPSNVWIYEALLLPGGMWDWNKKVAASSGLGQEDQQVESDSVDHLSRICLL